MWTIWRINWQIVKISVSSNIFVLTSTYLLSNILLKLLSIIDIISQNCHNLHLNPPSVNVIQMFNVLLTVHHAMILGNCPTWRKNSFQYIYLFIVLYMFRACHAHHQEKKIVRQVGQLPRIIQMVTQSVQSVSTRLLIYCELLYRQRRTKNWVSLTFFNICACTSNPFCEHRTLWSTIQVCAA